MPLLRQKLEQSQYSTSDAISQDDDEKFFDDLAEIEAAANRGDLSGEATDAEILAALDDDGPKPRTSSTAQAKTPEPLDANDGKRSKNVQRSRSKNVSPRRRRTLSKDAKTLIKMRSFCPAPETAPTTSLVVTPSPTSTCSINTPSPSLTPANDNLIPTWSLVGDSVKAVAATAALQLSDKPAHAFTFNLVPEAIEAALANPAGFLDHLKRLFDRELKRAGLDLPYWFAIDIDYDKRLHIHGAFAAVLEHHPAIRNTMKAAWGEWKGAGKHKQLLFSPQPCNDGWADYCLRNQRKVAKIIGSRTFTITRSLQREAQWTYSEIRRIMRGSFLKNSQF